VSHTKLQNGAFVGESIDPNDVDALAYADEATVKAAEVLREALNYLATYNVVIAHEVAALGIPVFTRDIDTLAVTIGGDGIVRWMVNPEFVADTTAADAAFYILHEVDHVLLAHLLNDQALRADPIFRQAAEIVINHRGIKLLPVENVPHRDGQPLIVCPKQEYKRYSKAKKAKGETPVDYDKFVSSDLACASYLREIPPPKSKKQQVCCRAANKPIPGQGDPNNGGGEDAANPGDHGDGIDPEQGGKLVDAILDSAMTRALKGDEATKDFLLDLGARLGEDHPIWGNMGLGALRGETLPEIEVSFWEAYLFGALTSILVPGAKLVYPKKLLAFEETYAESGFRLPFQPVGDENQTKLGISIDTSGSMPAEVLNKLARLVGNIPNCDTDWSCFDADVYPFEPGHSLRGGGGTSFQVVSDWVDEQSDEPFDCVLVVTDGHAPHIMPTEPDKWVWLITPGGDLWPADKGMNCVVIDLPE
jgi:hypothetical protein